MQTAELIAKLNEQHNANMAKHAESASKLEGLAARQLELEQLSVRRREASGEPAGWGHEIVRHDGYQQFLSMGMKGRVAIPVKALTTAADSGGALVAPDRREAVPLPRQRLTVRDLLAPGRTTSNLVEYPRQTGFTNNAAVVSEGEPKPQSEITYELATAPVRTVAHWIPVSRQAMQDAAQLRSLVDSELRYGLALAEEAQLLFGDGVGENLEGLVTQATAYSAPFTVEQETNLDTLLLAIAQAQQTLLPATGIIVNDLDWKRMQALKDAEGRYLGAGPFGTQPAVAWTLPVVATPSMAPGDFLVGAFGTAAQIFDHLDPTIFISDSHDDFFVRNMLAVLCEERLALAVKRPEGLVYGQFPAVSEGA